MPKNYPSTADLNKILTLYNDKKYIKAEVLAHQVLKKFPDNLFCLKMLGIIYRKINKMDESLKINKKIVSLF